MNSMFVGNGISLKVGLVKMCFYRKIKALTLYLSVSSVMFFSDKKVIRLTKVVLYGSVV